ncbi:MAG: hypothetical protein QF724_08760, partial [Planctomycetota bacterium]|nr:hypothetical protein [Planctomycetota bacterium]
MTNKDLEVRCPCCDTSITVDPLTGRILRAVEPDQRDETGKPVVDGERWDRVSEGAAQARHATHIHAPCPEFIRQVALA